MVEKGYKVAQEIVGVTVAQKHPNTCVVVMCEDGVQFAGFSRCVVPDKWNPSTGVHIALGKAVAEMLGIKHPANVAQTTLFPRPMEEFIEWADGFDAGMRMGKFIHSDREADEDECCAVDEVPEPSEVDVTDEIPEDEASAQDAAEAVQEDEDSENA